MELKVFKYTYRITYTFLRCYIDKKSVQNTFWLHLNNGDRNNDVTFNIQELKLGHRIFPQELVGCTFDYCSQDTEPMYLYWSGIYWEGECPNLENIKISILNWNLQIKKLTMRIEGNLRTGLETLPELVSFYCQGDIDFQGVYFTGYTYREIIDFLGNSVQDMQMEWNDEGECVINFA